MSFSLQHVLVFVVAVSVALIMAQHLQAAEALFWIAVEAGIILPFVPRRLRRHFVYGGLAGVVSMLIATGFFLQFVLEPISLRYTHDVPVVYGNVVMPYAVTIGFVLGATTGLIIRRCRQAKSTNSTSDARGR